MNKKFRHPIYIEFTKKGIEILTQKNSWVLQRFVKISGQHYGFMITTEQDMMSFQTHYPVICIKKKAQFLQIYEEGKMEPWLFDKTGNMIEEAGNFQKRKVR